MRHDKFRTVLRSTVGAVILMPALAFAQSNSSSPSGQGAQGSSRSQHSGAQGSGSEETTKQGSNAQGSSAQGSNSGSAGQGSQSSGSSAASGTSGSPSQAGTKAGSQSSSMQSSGMPSGSQSASGVGSTRQIDPAEVQRVFGSDATVVDLQSLGTEQIRTVQQALQDRGHYKGPIDGVYGPQTRAGVKAMLSQQNSLNQRLINQGQIAGPLATSLGISESDRAPVSGTDSRSGQGSGIRSQPSTQGTSPTGSSTGSANTGSSSGSSRSSTGNTGSSPSGSSSTGSSSPSGGSAGSSSAAPSGSQYPR